MSEAKIAVKIGQIEFSGEGDEAWLAEQLDKIIEKAPKLAAITFPKETEDLSTSNRPMEQDSTIANQPLVAFLKEKNVIKSQLSRFLATAIWLEAQGKKRLTVSDVTKALSEANQSRFGNPADCLNKNVKKGFCQKEGKQFFVTDIGKDSL